MSPTIRIFIITFLLAACSSPGVRDDPRRLYGSAAPGIEGRLIIIRPETRYVNVEGGELVRFQVDGQEFGWHFLVARTVHAFDLNDVAPQGLLKHRVRAFVTPDPRYIASQ
ncbi:MAG TPA: CzcE family metal-binding protein [Noviherbaspirillum sp.]|jgi:hypothetical protein|uniref:CzcE family metal-binding protein n=1 Tax=Noviherbaspirillum sp. TaxID=1926288 RepID=UPI002F941913